MPGFFISYLREDTSGYAGHLFDFGAHFGRETTFIDLDAIRASVHSLCGRFDRVAD